MGLEAVHGADDHGACCPTCGGAVRRRVYGEMHAGAFVLDGERLEIRRVPRAGHSDPIYLDALTQYFDGGLYRVWASGPYPSRGGKTIHREAWAAAFGPIPPDCDIHHRDDNILNNRLDNLECLPTDEHAARPRPASQGKRLPAATLDKAREWHQSDAGRLWHSRMASRAQSWRKWRREPRACAGCGGTFDALVRKNGHEQRYCSNVCKARAYRRRVAAGG